MTWSRRPDLAPRRHLRRRLGRLLIVGVATLLAVGIAVQPSAKPMVEQSDPSVVDLQRVATVGTDSDDAPAAGDFLLSPGTTSTSDTTVAAGTTTSTVPQVMHKVVLVIARWEGLSASGDATTIRSELTNLINDQVSSFWQTATNGAVAFTVQESHGWITTAAKACDNGSTAGTLKFWDEVRAKVGYVAEPAKHLVVWFPQADCGGMAGMGTIAREAGVNGSGSVWVNGSKIRSIFSHELGHNLGLGHSNLLMCSVNGQRVTDAAPSNCTSKDYADITDVMGVSHQNIGALSPTHLRTLGLLNGPDVVDVSGSVQVTLAPLSAAPTTSATAPPRVARLTLNGETYLVVNRASVGLDSWLSSTTGNGDPGVAIYRIPATGFDARSSYLADGDPSTADGSSATMRTILQVGTSASLQGGAWRVRTVGITNGQAVVEFLRSGDTTTLATIPATSTTSGTTLEQAVTTPSLAFTGSRVRRGTLVKVGTVWTAPVLASWAASTDLTSQSLDGVTLGADLRSASTRLNLATNARAADRLSLVATTLTGQQSATQDVAGTIRTETPQTGLVSYTGTWTRIADSGAHAGYKRVSTVSGSSAVFVAGGRSFGIVAERGMGHGVIDIYVNGTLKATVDTEATSTAKRQVVYSANYLTAAKRTITLVHRGSGTVALDGLVDMS